MVNAKYSVNVVNPLSPMLKHNLIVLYIRLWIQTARYHYVHWKAKRLGLKLSHRCLMALAQSK